jgi:hypothetical protein
MVTSAQLPTSISFFRPPWKNVLQDSKPTSNTAAGRRTRVESVFRSRINASPYPSSSLCLGARPGDQHPVLVLSAQWRGSRRKAVLLQNVGRDGPQLVFRDRSGIVRGHLGVLELEKVTQGSVEPGLAERIADQRRSHCALQSATQPGQQPLRDSRAAEDGHVSLGDHGRWDMKAAPPSLTSLVQERMQMNSKVRANYYCAAMLVACNVSVGATLPNVTIDDTLVFPES